MRWISDEGEARVLKDLADLCLDIDSDREETSLQRLVFGDGEAFTDRFAVLLGTLMRVSGSARSYYAVASPSPEYFWRARYGAYPAFELVPADSADEYIRALNSPVGSGDLRMNSYYDRYAIFPPLANPPISIPWFAYATRSDRSDTGHLWLRPEWIAEAKRVYPWLRDKKGTRAEMDEGSAARQEELSRQLAHTRELARRAREEAAAEEAGQRPKAPGRR